MGGRPTPGMGADRIPDREDVAGPPRRELSYDDLRVEEVLGRGGQAVVRRARLVDDDPPSVVALKEPIGAETLTPATVETFLDEAATWATVDERERTKPRWADSEFVVGVVDTGEELPWIATEYMDAGSLADRLAASDGLPVAEALWLGECICRGVEVAHSYGIAHLDLKPENVLLRGTPDGVWDHPKVADWGLARVLADRTGETEGLSVAYAAPEQFEPDEFGDPDTLTDIYQVGALVYALLTGEPPTTGSQLEVMRATLDAGLPAAPSEARPELSPAVDAAVLTALEREKTDRYGAITEFRDALYALRTGGRLPPVVVDRLDGTATTATTATEPAADPTAAAGTAPDEAATDKPAGGEAGTDEAATDGSVARGTGTDEPAAAEAPAGGQAAEPEPPTESLVETLATAVGDERRRAGFALVERAAAHPGSVLPHVDALLTLCEDEDDAVWAAAATVGNALQRRPSAVEDHVDRLLGLLARETDVVREPIADLLTSVAGEAALPLFDLAERLSEDAPPHEVAAVAEVLAAAMAAAEDGRTLPTLPDPSDAHDETFHAAARYLHTILGFDQDLGGRNPTPRGSGALANDIADTAFDEFLREELLETAIDGFLAPGLEKAGYGGIELAVTPEGTQLHIWAEEPGLVIGKDGENAERIADELESQFAVEDIEILVEELDE